MENVTLRTTTTNGVFDNKYINSSGLYVHCFNKMPSVDYVYSIDGEKAFRAFGEKYGALVQSIHRYREIEARKKADFQQMVVILNNEYLLQFNSWSVEISYSEVNGSFAQELVAWLSTFKGRRRRKPLEINLVVRCGSYLELKSMEVKRTKLDLDLFYEDDFRKTDETIRKRLSRKKDKGIVLLHGLPGTGKTTYLRYLVGAINKRVLFLSPNIAGNLVDPEFVELLIDNPDSILVIEDAENIIMDRKSSANSSVSNLLNISDGLLADFLNVQIICTFNSALTLVDSALMRKGRLIAKYEFGKLSVAKAQRLSDHLGFDSIITKPMTLAEITNQHEEDQVRQGEGIGFRRNVFN